MVVAAAEAPLHPMADTLTVAVPPKEEFQVTVPVLPVPLMLPALEGERLQEYPVAFEAEVV